jgi:hypothetical protein
MTAGLILQPCTSDNNLFLKESYQSEVEIREVTTMYCKNELKLTRELRNKLESELENNIRVRDNQSEENDNFNKVIKPVF